MLLVLERWYPIHHYTSRKECELLSKRRGLSKPIMRTTIYLVAFLKQIGKMYGIGSMQKRTHVLFVLFNTKRWWLIHGKASSTRAFI